MARHALVKRSLSLLFALWIFVAATVPALAQDWLRRGPGAIPAGQYTTVSGAICDGVTDTKAAIQAAVNAAAASNAKTVFFPPSSQACMLASNVVVPAGITLWAAPGTVTIKAKPGNTSNPLLLSVANVTDVRVSGLTFDGGGTGFASANNVLTVFSVTNVIFDDVQIQNTNGIGIIFSTSIVRSGIKFSRLINVGAAGVKQGIAFSSGSQANNRDNFAIGNILDTTGLDAISVTNQYNFSLLNNKASNAGAASFYVAGNNRVVIGGNTSRRPTGNGIDTASNVGVTISTNLSETAGASGIGVGYSADVEVTGNVSVNNNQAAGGNDGGLFLTGTVTPLSNVTVSGNNFSDNQALVSTTCTGTVGVGAQTCTVASTIGMTAGGKIKIAGAGVAAADLTVTLATISDAAVITWNTATSTSTSGAVVTGVPTQPYAIYQQPGGTVTGVYIGKTNIGTGSTSSFFGGNIYSYSDPFQNLYTTGASVGNGADTTEDTLQTFSVPGNTLLATGDKLHIVAGGTFAATTDTKTVRLKFGGIGGTTISAPVGSAGGQVFWAIDAYVSRTGSATFTRIALGRVLNNASDGTNVAAGAALDLTVAQTIIVTGQNSTSSSAGSIACAYLQVDLVKAP